MSDSIFAQDYPPRHPATPAVTRKCQHATNEQFAFSFVTTPRVTKRGRPTKRKSGKSYTQVERNRRHRKNKPKRLKAQIEAERRTRRLQATAPLGILHRAIAEVSEADLASNSVDAVITDPPYAESATPLYGELAYFAMRVLKPSGWCATMVGDHALARVLALMTGSGLIWQGLYVAGNSSHGRNAATKSYQAIKPILVLQKPPSKQPPGHWGPNLIAAPKDGWDKSLHEWQQSQEVFEKLVEKFTVRGDFVADPFAGSGTTLRAALTLDRRAWGSDIDAGSSTGISTEAESPPDDGYDGERDFSESINACYRVIRERAARGGPWWMPK